VIYTIIGNVMCYYDSLVDIFHPPKKRIVLQSTELNIIYRCSCVYALMHESSACDRIEWQYYILTVFWSNKCSLCDHKRL